MMTSFDGPGRGPHAEFDAAAFKGRARRAGGGGQPGLVADDDLAVGADIDEQGQFWVLVNAEARTPETMSPPT